MSETTRLGLALMAENDSGKYLTFNALADLVDKATARRKAVSVSSGNVTITTDEYQQNATFNITGASASGREITLPSAVERVTLWSAAAANAYSATVKIGANTVAISPGSAAIIYTDGAGSCAAILRGTAAVLALANLSDGPGVLGSDGQYLRIATGGTAWEWASRRKPITIGFEAALDNSEVFCRYVAEEAYTIPASLTGTVGNCNSPDGGSATVIDLKKNGAAAFGTITIGTGGAITLSAAGSTSFAIGDVLTATGPSTATTAAQFAATILGTI